MQQHDLPFEAAIITMALTNTQRRQLEPLVRRQTTERKGLLLVSVAPHVEEGINIFRMQALFLPWRKATRVLKIVQEGEM